MNPTAATATANYGGAVIGRTINHSGISGPVSNLATNTNTPATGSWPTANSTGHTSADYLSSNTQSVTITYELDQAYTLGDQFGRSYHLYNYNEGPDAPNPFGWGRGIRTASIYYQGASGSITDPLGSYTLAAANQTFLAAPGLNTYQGDDYGHLNGLTVRFVRFVITANYSNLQPAQGDFTGISEIRFIVPEPSSLLLAGMAIVGGCFLRRRRG